MVFSGMKSLQKLAFILSSAILLSSCSGKKDFEGLYTKTQQGYRINAEKSSPYKVMEKKDNIRAFRWIDGRSFSEWMTPGIYLITEPKDKMGSGIYKKCTHIDIYLDTTNDEREMCILPLIDKEKKSAEFFVFADEQYAKDKITASWGDYEDKESYKSIGFKKIDDKLYAKKIIVKYKLKPVLQLSSSTEIIKAKEVLHLTQ